MFKVNVSMSVDGFVAGPDVTADQAMGRRGEELHEWLFASPRDPVDVEVAAEMFSPDTVGAVLMGRRTLDVGIGHWGEDGTFGMPCFVVTHREHEPIAKGATTFTFVTDGLDRAVELARATAGDKDVGVMGAELVRQLLDHGLVDELEVTVVPIVLGGGAALFGDVGAGPVRLEQVQARPSSTVTHVRYRVHQA